MYSDPSKKILIVEDDLTYRDPLSRALSTHAYIVSTADDGEMAMEKLLFHRPNLIILDLLLPKVHGFEVLKRIRSYPEKEIAGTPVIILSNLSSEKDVETAQALGISAYCVKSETTFDEVLEKAQTILFPQGRTGDEEVADFSKPEALP